MNRGGMISPPRRAIQHGPPHFGLKKRKCGIHKAQDCCYKTAASFPGICFTITAKHSPAPPHRRVCRGRALTGILVGEKLGECSVERLQATSRVVFLAASGGFSGGVVGGGTSTNDQRQRVPLNLPPLGTRKKRYLHLVFKNGGTREVLTPVRA